MKIILQRIGHTIVEKKVEYRRIISQIGRLVLIQYATNMAHQDKQGYIVLEQEDTESLRSGYGKGWAKKITNYIIWGQEKDPYEKSNDTRTL